MTTTDRAPAQDETAVPPPLVTMSVWDMTEAIETLRASLARRPLDGEDEEYGEHLAQFAADAHLLARFSHALASAYQVDRGTITIPTDTEHTGTFAFVSHDDETLPAALGLPIDQGYEGLARGYQAAVAALDIPTGVSVENAAALYALHKLATNLAVAAVEAWRLALPVRQQ